MRFLLLHSPTWRPDAALAEAFAATAVETRAVAAPADVRPDARPTVLLVDPAARGALDAETQAGLVERGLALVALGAPGETELPGELPDAGLSAFVAWPAAPRRLLLALRTAFREATARREARLARAEAAVRTHEVAELTEIGIRLLTERDHDALLALILQQARRITSCDAGSLYLVETDDAGARRLRFRLAQNDSRPDLPFAEHLLPLDPGSLAGWAATSGEPLVLDDVQDLPPAAPYAFNRSFDARSGYRTKSMLVIPMSNHHGEVIGVLQLINRKLHPDAVLASAEDAEREVLPFSPHTVKLVRALAGQAAVSLENAQLHAAIERLFEGFVRAAVTAIEQRDPTTSGHSERVARMSVALAQVVDAADDGPYAAARFDADQVRELRYAALLHDVGKVSVREEVLTKPRKLRDGDLALIRQRHAYLIRTAEWSYERARAAHLAEQGPPGDAAVLARLAAERAAELAALERLLALVEESNQPLIVSPADTVVPPSAAELAALGRRTSPGLDGAPLPWLTGRELADLAVRRGSLNAAERREIESHVTHTYAFLRSIPWTRGLRGVPEIARGHHEKLDGSGYPLGIGGAAIPVPTRIMTITDIYDALTAADRPYKRAVAAETALDILRDEVAAGMLDAGLFRLFVEGRVWTTGAGPD
ncbi:MAG TPA: HD domain-containing phosphohydrolase [Gemmatimonadales bacterium]|nr:HD domain-containing phosphohydrolase [Gemmatimonadales bacterium]